MKDGPTHPSRFVSKTEVKRAEPHLVSRFRFRNHIGSDLISEGNLVNLYSGENLHEADSFQAESHRAFDGSRPAQ